MYEKLLKLRKEFDSHRPFEQVEDASDHSIKGAFLTLHKHFTAATVEILHLGCELFHPETAPATARPPSEETVP